MESVHPAAQRRAFALVELCILIGVTLAILCLVALASGDSRRRARLSGSLANIHRLWEGYAAFGTDNANRVAAFSWRAGETHPGFPVAADDLQAAANQAVDIIRRRGNRPEFQQIQAWFPYAYYTHLVVADYLEQDLPAPWFASPGDTVRLAWQRNPAAFLTLDARPTGTDQALNRWPYSSSYEIGPAFYSPNAQVNTPQGPVPTVAQDPMGHRFYSVGNTLTVLGNRRFDEVAFPSQKAMLYEEFQRYFGDRPAFFAYNDSRVPVITADGAAAVRANEFTNLGFSPNNPTSVQQTRFPYVPNLAWEPAALNGATQVYVNGGMRWTRSGLRGRDFGGPEVQWVP